MKTINKVLAVLLFPIIWAAMYIFRIVWFDFIVQLLDTIAGAFISPIYFVFRLITLPIALIVDIPIGFVVTLIYTIKMCKEIFSNEIDLATAVKEFFQKNRRQRS